MLGKLKYTHDSSFFSHDTPEAFYWAGFIAADGCVVNDCRDSYELCIELSTLDKHHLEKFIKAIKYNSPIKDQAKINKLPNRRLTKIIRSSRVRINIKNSKIREDLEKRFNIVPRKSLIYRFPRKILNHKLVNHFLRGYFDGDGCISIGLALRSVKSKNRFDIVLVGTQDFLTHYQNIIRKNCKIDHTNKIVNDGKVYRLSFGGARITTKILDFLYRNSKTNTRLDRKHILAYDKRLRGIPESFNTTPVIAIHIKTGKRRAFSSLKQAAFELGLRPGGISKCVCKTRPKYRGYRFIKRWRKNV